MMTGALAGDGVSNLLKYALNLSPVVPAPADALPRGEVVEGRLTHFPRGDSRTDLDYVVEVSSTSKAGTPARNLPRRQKYPGRETGRK